jgi:hypothetical protein
MIRDEISLIEAIYLIAKLPFIEEWYTPDSKEIKEELAAMNLQYASTARWLNYLMLDGEKPNDEENGYYWFALWAQRLHFIITGLDLMLVFERPIARNYYWLLCLTSDSNSIVRNKGIESAIETGRSAPNIFGKSETLKIQSCALQKYDLDRSPSAKQVKFSPIPKEQQQDYFFYHLRSFIEGLAFKTAKHNALFKKNHWNPYYEALVAFNDIVRKDVNYQLSYLLPSGDRFVTGKNKKLPKGFSHKKCN